MLNLVKDLLLNGNAYVVGIRNHRNEFSSLHLINARSTSPYIEPDSKEVFYACGQNPFLGDLDALIPSRDVMHIRLHTPRHPLIGVSPIEHAATSIAANAAITGHQAAFFNNMSRPSGVLSTDMKLTADQMVQLRTAWEAQSTNMNSGRIPILGSGITWEPMSISSQDAQLVQAFQMTVEDVARSFRVPLPLVGDYRHATYNNVEQLISSWLSTGLGFVLEHIELSFDKFFGLPRGQFTEFDVDALLRTDFAGRVDGLTKGIQQGLFTPNEARAKMGGLPAVPDGDIVYAQQQMKPLGYEEPQPEPTPIPQIEEPEQDPEAAKGAAIFYLKGMMNDG
jgi:HK97 family phage portal protein